MLALLHPPLGNTDYAFLEPTLAGHVESIAKSPQAIGMLFSVTSLTYTFSSPLMGWLSHKHRMGPRTVIIAVTYIAWGRGPPSSHCVSMFGLHADWPIAAAAFRSVGGRADVAQSTGNC
ncbi:hypothetical protein T492DRAFT_831493 [Pavlovales sp. CCMP2436]|nr:hypothetical protein T492DRAFT_831493 [Pavlovales sp. CCMP2436]